MRCIANAFLLASARACDVRPDQTSIEQS